jgi:hypothetical protein
MTQEVADHHRICPFFDEFEGIAVAQLVRMDAPFDPCPLRKALEFVPDVLAVDRLRSVGNEREQRS